MWEWLPSGRWQISTTSIDRIADYVKSHDRVIVSSTSVFDEGIDVPEFAALILATAMQKYRRTIQRLGRGMRPKADNRVFIFDFCDKHHNFLQKHSHYRKATYEAEEMELVGSLEEMSRRMGIPLVLEAGLYHWYQSPTGSRSERDRDE